MVVAGEGGFLLEGETDGIQSGLGFAKTIFWGKGFGKTETNFFGGNVDLVSRAEEGSGEESARASDLKFSENGDYKIRKHKIEKIYDFC